jgi:hypothetical protein
LISFGADNSTVLPNFVSMKPVKRRVVSKGDRLKWTSLKELKPVKLSSLQVEGHALTAFDLMARNSQPSKVFLVP